MNQACWIWLNLQPLNEKLIELLWQLEVITFLIPRGFPLAGNC